MRKKITAGKIIGIVLIFLSAFSTNSYVFAEDGVNVHVRYQDNVAFFSEIQLPVATTTTLSDLSGELHDISSNSALYILSLADATSSAFSISDLQYYPSFSSFYVNCIDINATSTIHACGNWQYAVNGSNPFVGSDKYIAKAGDDIYFYFGNQRQFFVSSTSTDTVTPITVTAQKYDYVNNLWLPLSEEVINATQSNPEDPWNPFIVATSTTDTNGVASLFLATAGVYNIGLSDDGYYPTTITVSTSTPVFSPTPTPSSSPTPEVPPTGGSLSNSHHVLDVAKAFQFLVSKQKSDGSFGGSMYTDWVAIALASGGQSTAKEKITSYFQTSTNSLTSATDYERRAMALMALNINPYDGTSINFIQKIVDQFDGDQIGDSSLVNDDIFAIFPLMKAEYSSDDPIIKKIIAFILKEQKPNGSWEDSVDLTASAIQALEIFPSSQGVSGALQSARAYLSSGQLSDGGFGSSFSTSWTLQAITALQESSSDWLKNGNNPEDALYSFQQNDGGVETLEENENTRIWATSYAIPGALHKTWFDILHSFSKKKVSLPEGSNKQNETNVIEDRTLATSTNTNATTTLPAIQHVEPVQKVIVPNFTANNSNNFQSPIISKLKKTPEVEKIKEKEKVDYQNFSQSASAITASGERPFKNAPISVIIAIITLLLVFFIFKLIKK